MVISCPWHASAPSQLNKKPYLLGAIRAYVPSGQAILKSVLTTARPPSLVLQLFQRMTNQIHDNSSPARA